MMIPFLFAGLFLVAIAVSLFAIYYFDLIEAPELRQPRHGAERTVGWLRRALARLPRRHRNLDRQEARASSRRAWGRYARAETGRLASKLKGARPRRQRRADEAQEETEVLGALAGIREDIRREDAQRAAAVAHLQRRWTHGTGQWPLYKEVVSPPEAG